MASTSDDDAYISEYPAGCTIHPDIKALIKHYYTVVDTRGKHAEYSECFAESGSLIVPMGKTFNGRTALKSLHEGMWSGIEKRRHCPDRIFPFGDNPNEVVVIGRVKYWQTDGSFIQKDMASYARYQRNDGSGRLEIANLQVWLSG